MKPQTVDHVALLPAYIAAGTAVLAFLADLVAGRRAVVTTVAGLGTVATGIAAVVVGTGRHRSTFCLPEGCSYVADRPAAVVATLFAVLTLLVLLLSAPALRELPAGEYCFLLTASMAGGVVLGYARDLITLIIALETLTLPLYALVGLRRRAVASAEGAVTFFVVSVVSTAVTLLGAALLYTVTGAVHLSRLAAALASPSAGPQARLTAAGVTLVLVGLAFKVAAVPFHAWAPPTYDGAPLPIAAYLSTASKLGGVIALLYVTILGLRPWLDVAGPILAVIAVLTMTVGNLVALRQRRMVRLLAWSSVAQAGYLLAPLGAVAVAGRALPTLVAAVVAYTAFYVLMELGAFGAVIALRGAEDGGRIDDYAGAARRAPWVTGAFVLALAGLAGLPPGLAGLFAKVVVVRALLHGGAAWLAVIVGLNAVIGLAYYVRVAAVFFRPPPPPVPRTPIPGPLPSGAPARIPTSGASTSGVPTSGASTAGVPASGVPTTRVSTSGIPASGAPTSGAHASRPPASDLHTAGVHASHPPARPPAPDVHATAARASSSHASTHTPGPRASAAHVPGAATSASSTRGPRRPGTPAPTIRTPAAFAPIAIPVAVGLALATAAALVVGFAPQLIAGLSAFFGE